MIKNKHNEFVQTICLKSTCIHTTKKSICLTKARKRTDLGLHLYNRLKFIMYECTYNKTKAKVHDTLLICDLPHKLNLHDKELSDFTLIRIIYKKYQT